MARGKGQHGKMAGTPPIEEIDDIISAREEKQFPGQKLSLLTPGSQRTAQKPTCCDCKG